MRKSFLIGLGVAFLLLLLGWVMNDLELYGKITLGIGIVSILISGLFSGVFATPDQMKANIHSEDVKDRRRRRDVSLYTGAFAVPFIIIGGLLLYYF